MKPSISLTESKRLRAIDEALTEAVEAGQVPGCVAAVGSSAACEYLGCYGMASSSTEVAMAADTVFRIASMTKLVTAIAVMRLVDEGRVELDATMSDYVSGFVQPEVLVEFDPGSGRYSTRPASRDATLRELLSHTGGYGYWWLHEPLRVVSGADPNLLDPPFLIAEPGSGFAYSTSADVIGRLFRPVTGGPIETYFERHIFTPLSMPDTGFQRPAELSRLAHVHRRRGGSYREIEIEEHDPEPRGGGGLFSTAGDYLRLLRCLLRGGEIDGIRLLSGSAVNEIASNQIGDFEARMQRTALAERSNDFIFMDGTQKFGFGVMIETAGRPGMRSVGSYGWGGIVNTYFWVDPDRDLAAVLMLQIAPFASRPCVDLMNAFEQAVYRSF